MLLHYQPFRFWCQKVLPLVYDDSLSYYELLCKVVDYLNKMGEGYEALAEDFEELKQYVEQFVSEEIEPIIDAKLQEMIDDGVFEGIINRDMSVDYCTPDMFGAVGDGNADDTVAVQAAFDDGRNVCFLLDKIYRITDTIHLRKKYPVSDLEELERLHNLGVYHLGRTAFSKAPNNHANPNATIYCDFADTSHYVFSIETPDWTFANLLIRGRNDSGTYSHKLFTVNIENEDVPSNVDCYIKDCRIENFNTIMDFTGRGCLIENCNIAHGGKLIDIKWNDGDDSGSIYHDEYTGPRAIRIVGNRLHAMQGSDPMVRIRSGTGFGFEFINNHIDRGRNSFLRCDSAINNWLISGNNFTGLRGTLGTSDPLMVFYDDVRNLQFTNNRISNDYPGEGSSFHFTNMMLFSAGKVLSNSVIANNTVSMIKNGNMIILTEDAENGIPSCSIENCVIANNAIGKIFDLTTRRALLMGSGLTMKNTSVVGNVIGEAYPVEAFDVFAVLSAGSCSIENCKIMGNSVCGTNVTFRSTGSNDVITNTIIDDNLMNFISVPAYTEGDEDKGLAVNENADGLVWREVQWSD